MINLDSITSENNKEHNEKWPFNLINKQDDIDKKLFYAKDLYEPKYEYLIKNHKNTGIKHLIDPNTFIGCFNMMDDVYESIHN